MKKRHLLPLLVYAALTVVMTWPTLPQAAQAIPGDGFDGWQNYWNLWWIREALLVQQTHIFFTDILYPPTGVSLLFHTLNFFNGLWTLPLQLNFNLALSYNAVVFFHFTMAGYGVYLLALWVLGRVLPPSQRQSLYPAAFVAGAIYTFAPFHMAHLLGHMQVFSLTWPPFYILWLLRLLATWQHNLTQGRVSGSMWLGGLRPTDLALTGLFLALVTTIDWYQTLYMLLFTALALGWFLWRGWRKHPAARRKLGQPVLALALMGLGFGLIFSPLIVPMAIESTQADYMRPSFEENIILSADLLAFVLPSELHPLWGPWVQPIYNNFTTTTSERLIFWGWTPLLLSLMVVWWRPRSGWTRFWLLVTLVFAVLSLGPYLHINGQIVSLGERWLALPYLLLYEVVPFIGISRSLSRYTLVVMIALGVLAALALAGRRPVWSWLALLLICFEFWVAPYPMSVVDTPAFFDKLAADGEDYTIAALPMNWDRPTPLLYQTHHGKALLTAYTSRNNPLDLSWRTPIFQHWRHLGPDIIQADLAALAPTIFADFGLRYVVLDYYQMPPGPEREGTETWVRAALPQAQPIHQDERLTVFAAPPPGPPQPYLQLGEGWGPLETIADHPLRQIDEHATVRLRHLAEARQLRLTSAAPVDWTAVTFATDNESVIQPISTTDTEAIIVLPPGSETLGIGVDRSLRLSGLSLDGP